MYVPLQYQNPTDPLNTQSAKQRGLVSAGSGAPLVCASVPGLCGQLRAFSALLSVAQVPRAAGCPSLAVAKAGWDGLGAPRDGEGRSSKAPSNPSQAVIPRGSGYTLDQQRWNRYMLFLLQQSLQKVQEQPFKNSQFLCCLYSKTT